MTTLEPVLGYIASPSYSGSTLLTFLLGTHPGISTVGELKGRLYGSLQVPERCSCGSSVAACPFWNQVAQRVRQRGLPCELTDLGTYFHAPGRPLLDRLLRARVRGRGFEALRGAAIDLVPGGRDELQRLLERNRVLGEVVCELQGGPVLLDSSKDAVRLRFMLDAKLWDVRVIHLLRDGRGTANSFVKRDRFPMQRAARRWRSAHESFARVTAPLPAGRVHCLRYEDLAADPGKALRGVLAFLGLEPEGARFDFKQREHHVFGNPMRLRDSSEIVLDESWRHELQPSELETFERIAGDLNRRFGYGAEPPP